MELKELVTGLLSKTLNMDDSGVAELYNSDGTVKDDALDTLLVKDADRVKNLKPNITKVMDDQYKKGVRETMERFEKDFKDKTGFDSDLKGIDLVLAYADTKTITTADVTEDAVKKHKLYISTVDKLKKEKAEAVDAAKKELDDFKGVLSKKEAFSKVSAKAIEIFNSFNPILSKDKNKAKNQMDDFISKLNNFEYDIQGDRIVVLQDGKPVEDGHGHAKTFDLIIKETADRYFDFQVTDPNRKSTENGELDENGKPKKKPLEVTIPQSETEYTQMLTNPKLTLEQKVEVKKLWEEKTKKVST